MASNPLDGLLENATRDYPQQGNDVLMEWWAQEYGPRLLAAVKAARDAADDGYITPASLLSAMSTAAEVQP